MNASIYQRVVRTYDNFELLNPRRFSSPAIELIAEVLSLIIEDPHPRWRFRNDTSAVLADYFDRLPRLFTEVAASTRSADDIVTAFDVLHWFSRNLDSGLCTIPKD